MLKKKEKNTFVANLWQDFFKTKPGRNTIAL